MLFAYCFYLGVALPKFLSNAMVARWLGNGVGVLGALAILLPVEYLYEHSSQFPGVTTWRTFIRHYPYHSLAAQVLGYVGEVSPSELL